MARHAEESRDDLQAMKSLNVFYQVRPDFLYNKCFCDDGTCYQNLWKLYTHVAISVLNCTMLCRKFPLLKQLMQSRSSCFQTRLEVCFKCGKLCPNVMPSKF